MMTSEKLERTRHYVDQQYSEIEQRMQRAVDAALRIFEAVAPRREPANLSCSDKTATLSCWRGGPGEAIALHVSANWTGWRNWRSVSTAERLHAFGLLRGLIDLALAKYPLPEPKQHVPTFRVTTKWGTIGGIRWSLVPAIPAGPIYHQPPGDEGYLLNSDAKEAARAAAQHLGITIVA